MPAVGRLWPSVHDGDVHDGDGHNGDGHDGVDDIVTTMMGKKIIVGMRTIATNCTMILYFFSGSAGQGSGDI